MGRIFSSSCFKYFYTLFPAQEQQRYSVTSLGASLLSRLSAARVPATSFLLTLLSPQQLCPKPISKRGTPTATPWLPTITLTYFLLPLFLLPFLLLLLPFLLLLLPFFLLLLLLLTKQRSL